MKSFSVVVLFSIIACNSSWKIFHRGRGKHGNLGDPPTKIKVLPEELYFDQKLDHFNPSNTQTWKQRYFENGTFYKSGGPIFLMIGGEAEASPKWLVAGTWIEYAEKYNAHCILVEHRFYGKSRPLGDLSTENLTYLTSEQALADLAWFIASFNKKRDFVFPPKWILFGGSYPGSLAAWMRLKYPHLVHGAVSSSGPLLALTDFKDYYRVVGDSLTAYDPLCVTAIKTGTEQLSSLLIHSEGRSSISKLFKLCDPVDINNENDISNLYESLASNFAGIVQYNKDNRHTNSRKVDITIDSVCDLMVNKSFGLEVNRLAEINNLLLKASEEPCLNFKYEKMIEDAKMTSWDSEAAEGLRQWLYQSCTEFGFFQSSDFNSTKEMFGDKFPVKFLVNQCADIFGSKFDVKFVNDATSSTNSIYGGLDDQAVNVIYVHGSIDPWHALGITKTLKVGAPAIFIKGTAHCANMYPPSEKDLPQLIAARKEIGRMIGEWLI